MFAVVIPTRNRPLLISAVLANLGEQSLKPDRIVVVDSSDLKSESKIKIDGVPIYYLFTDVKSAAEQRNIGIEFIKKSQDSKFLSFVDDDVILPSNYFERIASLFDSYNDAVGISGTTQQTNSTHRNTRILRIAGVMGDPGTLTSAVINIAPPSSGQPVCVEWLMGVSSWRTEKLKNVRFERDFKGQSIFEDVIFSARMKASGTLVCVPDLKIEHLLSNIQRMSTLKSFKQWTENRYRIFRYPIKNISKTRFWISNLLMMFLYFIESIIKLRTNSFFKFLGIMVGMISILKKQLLPKT